MTDFHIRADQYTNAEIMANDYLEEFFGSNKIKYPISPFEMLNHEGVTFLIRNFKNLEGVYIAPSDSDDIPLVAINANRPITRQRFTAAHELCHHFKDAGKHIACPAIGIKNST